MSLRKLYEDAIYSSSTSLTEELWGYIPRTLADIPQVLKNVDTKLDSTLREHSQEQETIIKVIERFHRENNLFTPETRMLIDQWFQSSGSIEAGHQPLYLGGASFVLNKISFAGSLAKLLYPQSPLIPIFFIGDHDEVQNELLITRAPQSLSYTGLELKAEYGQEYIQTPMHKLPKPDETIVLAQIEKIRQNYQDLFRFAKIRPEYRPLLETRLENCLEVITESYWRSSSTFSNWIIQLWGDLLLFKNRLPILLISGSDRELRQLILPYLEDLLKESNRKEIITISNDVYNKISDTGLKPALPIKENDYVPFFLECSTNSHSRIRLTTNSKSLTGECPVCHEKYDISYNPDHPDLTEYAEYLSPRVDSRSIAVNRLFKTRIRITGGGETSYYAQLLPIFRKMQIKPIPLVIKQPRIFYNTPWAEKMASDVNIANQDLPTMHIKENFQRIGKISKSTDAEELKNLIIEEKDVLASTNTALSKKLQELSDNPNLAKDKNLKKQYQILSNYLSMVYGTYTPGKSYQEVSWHWLDLGLITGINDIVGFYRRNIKQQLPVSATLWLSAGKYT